MLTFYCHNKVEYLKEALESCRHQIWFLFQNLILSCQKTFLIGYNLSFLINGGKTLVTCIEECNTKYHRLSNDTTPTFCAYHFLDIKTIKINLQSPWQEEAPCANLILHTDHWASFWNEAYFIFFKVYIIITWVPTDLSCNVFWSG